MSNVQMKPTSSSIETLIEALKHEATTKSLSGELLIGVHVGELAIFGTATALLLKEIRLRDREIETSNQLMTEMIAEIHKQRQAEAEKIEEVRRALATIAAGTDSQQSDLRNLSTGRMQAIAREALQKIESI